jgi:F1F0 ATPase subunit 2
MNETLRLMLALATGVLLGAIFFGGLWWTIQKGVSSKWSALWFFGSLLVRTSMVLAGFYFIARGHWQRLIVGLIGFVIARFIVTRITQSAEKQTYLEQKVSHAP